VGGQELVRESRPPGSLCLTASPSGIYPDMEALETRFADTRDGQACTEHSSRISRIFVQALLEAVEASGASVDEFLRRAGPLTQQFATPYGWVEAAEVDRLTCLAVEVSGDPAFGLHWVERSPMMKFDLLTVVTAHAPTLRDALDCVLRFQPILYERPELTVLERPHSVFLRLAPLASSELALRVRTEFGVAALLRLMRHVGAPAAAVRSIAFAHRAPSYAQEYSLLFGDRARFGRACSGIEIDAAWLDRRLHGANVELYQVLTLQAQQVLARVQSAVRHAGQVRDYLRLQFPRLPEMREAARALAMSERSLRRRLAEEGWSYSAILQESQLLLAQQRLADPRRSIQQVASDVGFTSTAAFHRAFKRWTGESPAVFRSTGTHGDVSVEHEKDELAVLVQSALNHPS